MTISNPPAPIDTKILWERVKTDGYAIVPPFVTARTISRLIAAVEQAQGSAILKRRNQAFAIRNLLESVPEIAELAEAGEIAKLVAPILGEYSFPVRATLFDKRPEANWKVPWHQDLTIEVRDRVEVDGYSAWSVKKGVACVQPPASVLARMVAVRIHLDDCNESDGPLRVLPGTHREGRLDGAVIARLVATVRSVTCCVEQGGAVVMRPLLLHASSNSRLPRRRRVIHIEYAAHALPSGLHWLREPAGILNW